MTWPILDLTRVAELQAEVVHLRGHKERCEHATLGLLRELLEMRARMQLQASELRQLQQEVQQAAWSPEKEILEFPGPQSQNQMQVLDKRYLTHEHRLLREGLGLKLLGSYECLFPQLTFLLK